VNIVCILVETEYVHLNHAAFRRQFSQLEGLVGRLPGIRVSSGVRNLR
jgi:hypothetical protein